MIPKRIHYTWFSKDPFPPLIQRCIASWKNFMPDYEFVLWDMSKIEQIDSCWLKECISAKKWAFAADFVRLWALYHEGGIYLDTDFEVYQSFDSLLNERMFIGREGVPYILLEKKVNVFLGSHCFGAEKRHPFVKENLEYYKDRHFIMCSGSGVPKHLQLDMTMMPYIQSEIAKKYGYDASYHADITQRLEEGIVVYPTTYFGIFGSMKPMPKTYGRHHGAGSWREEKWQDTTRYTLGYKIMWRVRSVWERVIIKSGYYPVKI